MYKVIGNNEINNILGTLADNRGIKDIEQFLEISRDNIISPYKLSNMKKAVEVFDKHKNSKECDVTVICDSDP